METDNPVYFSDKVLETLAYNMRLSPSTAHKIMNPFCGQCIAERGERWLNQNSAQADDSQR